MEESISPYFHEGENSFSQKKVNRTLHITWNNSGSTVPLLEERRWMWDSAWRRRREWRDWHRPQSCSQVHK